MLALVLLGPAAVAVADGRDVLADAKDNGRIDACYSRAEFREATRLARADQRLYADLPDLIAVAGISHVERKGQPCGSDRAIPSGAVDVDSSGWAGLWGGVALAVGVVAVGAGAVARRGSGGRD